MAWSSSVQALQVAVNRWASAASFSPICTDGLWGGNTISAVGSALGAIANTLPDQAPASLAMTSQISQDNAAMLAPWIDTMASAAGMPIGMVHCPSGCTCAASVIQQGAKIPSPSIWSQIPLIVKLGGGALIAWLGYRHFKHRRDGGLHGTKIVARGKCEVTGLRGGLVSMRDIKECASVCGSHWFDKGAMRFFRSRVGETGYTDGEGGAYFVSSEQGPYGPRMYSVRRLKDCTFDTIGEFQGYKGRATADRAAKKFAQGKAIATTRHPRDDRSLNGHRRL